MAECEHLSFRANVEVSRLHTDGRADSPTAFAADITVACADCGAPFGWRCHDVGLMPDRPACSPDALTLRVPMIAPSELTLLGPLAAMRTPAAIPGFRVRQAE